ncbi:lipopolysaccharide biosynthesis protein [uncultured Sphingobacterium sp.]|uniref:lipopolysaccharide biosynthesis protein n=1 Tax=uncultured Sphingobacterium sp. TaxID=182688 RepID=UPI0037482340
MTKEVTFKEFLKRTIIWSRYLMRHWYLLLGLGILGSACGFFYAQSKQITYLATTTFVLESSENSGMGLSQYAGIASMVGVDLGGSGGGIFQGDNIIELYKSRKMIEAALMLPSTSDTSKLLMDRFIDNEKDLGKWSSEKKSAAGERAKDSIVLEAVSRINRKYLSVVKPDKKLSIIKVDVKFNDEIFAKEFNEGLVKEVNDFYIKTKTKKSLNNIAILQHKTDSVRAVMNGNIATTAIIIDATPNLNPTRQAQRLVPSQKSQFSAETNKAILEHLIQNLELAKMNLLKEAPLIQVVDIPIYPLQIFKVSKIMCIAFSFIFFVFFGVLYLIIKRTLADVK